MWAGLDPIDIIYLPLFDVPGAVDPSEFLHSF